jgi:hypothetical protein
MFQFGVLDFSKETWFRMVEEFASRTEPREYPGIIAKYKKINP